MRVLVTGAGGFVGHAVAGAFTVAGHDVVGLVRELRALPAGVVAVVGDLTDPVSVRAVVNEVRPDAVCHLGAVTRVREANADPLRYWRTNVGGTLALLDALTAQPGPPPRVVAASSCVVYGRWWDGPATEDLPNRPDGTYATTKAVTDELLAGVAATGTIGAVSLRSYNVAGAIGAHHDRDETRLIPKVVAVAQGRATELRVNGDGSAVRDWVHVADMAEAFVRAVDACRPGLWRAYNVGSGLRSTIADVVAATEAVTGRALRVRHGPPADEPSLLWADASRIRRELGWRPHRSQLSTIIADAMAATGYSTTTGAEPT